MKKGLLALVVALVLGGVAVVKADEVQLLADGYTKICSELPDGEYCHYCKCKSGEGHRAIPDFKCDDGTTPICVQNNKEAEGLNPKEPEPKKD